MREHFKIYNPGDYMDELYLQQKKVRIDFKKFDDFLGKYNGSMSDHIENKYGEKAMFFVLSVL